MAAAALWRALPSTGAPAEIARDDRFAAGIGAGSRTGVRRLEVYSVDDCSVQLTWSGLGGEAITLGAGPVRVEVPASPPAVLHTRGRPPRRLNRLPGGPGTALLDGLRPDTDYEVWADAGSGRRSVARIRTLPRPAGRLLTQLATVNDIHVGERRFGLLGVIEDRHPLPEGTEPYPLRCVRAALEEARAWGASHAIVKGDLTRDSDPAELRTVGRLLAGCGMTADVVLGNHDVRHGVDAHAVLSAYGLDARPVARARDLPGLRVILAHTPGPGDKWGLIRADQADAIARLARAAPGPCMLVVHHPPATSPLTTHYPPGIYHGSSRELLRRLATANPAAVIVAGHTHRNRVHRAAGLPCVETSSTKDYPGGWTGYRVFEHGIVQTARRTAAPQALSWTEASARALGGQWGRWSPGRLSDRSWSMQWPTR